MSPRSVQSVRKGLLAKGMAEDERHHHMFTMNIEGVAQVITRISHGTKKELSDYHLGLMARQCFLRVPEFRDLVDCPLSEKAWRALIKERSSGGGGKSPFI